MPINFNFNFGWDLVMLTYNLFTSWNVPKNAFGPLNPSPPNIFPLLIKPWCLDSDGSLNNLELQKVRNLLRVNADLIFLTNILILILNYSNWKKKVVTSRLQMRFWKRNFTHKSQWNRLDLFRPLLNILQKLFSNFG